MITKTQNANGLWWRLLATLSVLAILFTINTTAMAQNKKTSNDKVFEKVEDMPEFPGGEQAMMDFVSKNVVYPQEAQEKGISGRVFVSFIVEKDGSVNEVKVMRGIGGGCDEESVRVIKAMPKWKPGKMKGKPVRVSYMMPIIFKLQ
jgi:protein TonB